MYIRYIIRDEGKSIFTFHKKAKAGEMAKHYQVWRFRSTKLTDIYL